MMARCVWLLTLAAAGADLVSWERAGNTVRLRLSDGAAELEWISPSTYRLRRCQERDCRGKSWANESVEFTVTNQGLDLSLESKYLAVRIRKAGLLFQVGTHNGKSLIREVADSERTTPADERFYGLGARIAPSLDLRGSTIESTQPLLISSAGYGQYFIAPRGGVTFDLAKTAPGRVRITATAPVVESFLYYGPSPKEVLEEHLRITGSISPVRREHVEILTADQLPSNATRLPVVAAAGWASLEHTIRMLAHVSFSGVLTPVLDMAAYDDGPGPAARAAQLGAIMPYLTDARAKLPRPPGLAAARRVWAPYLITYLEEARERGLPVIHPLALQYPSDPEAARHSDVFMLGDEVLVAPIYTASNRRSVYLPMGTWTDLLTNRTYPGRRTIDIEAAEESLPVLVKNGSILPLVGRTPGSAAGPPAGLLELHYFPRLAAEFFLHEPDNGLTAQYHASPAGDYVRLESESKVARVCEWVVHHVGPPREVSSGDRRFPEAADRAKLAPGAWYYDRARRNLHILVDTPANSDIIINISLQDGSL